MSAFSHPYLLFALMALPILSVLSLLAARKRRRGLIAMAGLVGGLVLGRARPSRLRAACLWLALVCLALGMAGPRWGRDWSQSAAPGRDLVVVLDLSRSMFAEAPSRVERAQQALLDLCEGMKLRGGHRVALVVFAGQPRLACPLTHDLDHFRDVVTALDTAPDPTLGAGTRIGSALVLATQTHEGRTSARDILLVSDGDDPARDGEWRRGIEAARAEGVRVICVGVGDAAETHSVPDGKERLMHAGKEVRTRLEDAPLREIARRTNGELILADGRAVPLAARYRALAEVAGDEDSPDRMPAYRQRQGWFLLPAFLLLCLGMVLPESRGAR